MRDFRLPLLAYAFLTLAIPKGALAQDVGAVSPVSAPIPLPGSQPIAPPLLRSSKNPSVLPMTGDWRFALTHGRIIAAGNFVGRSAVVTASSEEGGNPAVNAFDGQASTRWCADGSGYPQWLQADFGTAQAVKTVDLTWERPAVKSEFRLQGSSDGKTFTDLEAISHAPADSSDGIVQITAPRAMRYFRVYVTGAAEGWASIRECKITLEGADGTDTVWKPSSKPASDTERDVFAAPKFDDSGWHSLSVPSNWEMAGYSIPTYNSVDDTVGLYRRVVKVPPSFAGKRILWRFDGVLDGAEIWVNGHRAGYHESGYTGWDIDLTDLVKPGEDNLFAVRVSKSVPSVDCETGDFQCMGGIFRENYLIALPQTHIGQVIVTTKLDAAYRDSTLSAVVSAVGASPGQPMSVTGELIGPGGVRIPLEGFKAEQSAGADGKATLTLAAPVVHPKLWSAEKPNLYYVILTLSSPGKPDEERVEQRFGFRQIDIKNGVVLWNGVPIKCRGVCRHDEWADKGFALTEENWRKDLDLMRFANVNAIRTSHYNHAERFLELCDEMGFYILDEVPFCWLNQNFSNPDFTPYLIQRAQETVARDRNRACVLAWSLGNENGHGSDGQAVMDCVTALDSTRPAFVSQMWNNGYKGQAFRDAHYPVPADIVGLASADGDVSAPANFSEHPHMFYQKEALAYDPGVSDLWGDALQDCWDLIWPQPTILGAFIWEWQNQGIADPNPDKTRDFYYGPDHLRQENNKGLVDAYRKPKGELAYVRQVYSPVGIGADSAPMATRGGSMVVALTNRYSFTDLSELTCQWTALSGDRPMQHGARPIACPPGQSVAASFAAPAGTTALRLEFVRADGSSVIGATIPAAGYSPPRPTIMAASRSAASRADLAVEEKGNELSIHTGGAGLITFDRKAARLIGWSVAKRSLLTGGPVMNFGETRLRGSAPKDYLYSETPAETTGSRLTWTRMPEAIVVTTTARVNGPDTDHPDWGSLYTTYTLHVDGSVDIAWALYWKSGTPAHAWEAGLKMTADKDLLKMRWSRRTPFSDFPPGHPGAPEGQCRATEESFRGSKRDLNYLSLTAANGEGLVLAEDGDPLVGRAASTTDGVLLFASREVAGPRDLSYPYVAAHDIVLTKESSLRGKFRLYPTGIR